MKNPLSETELATALPGMDDSLVAEGMPLYLRPQECFKRVYGSVQDNEGRKELFEPIILWFVQRYGYSAMEWDRIIGRVPILLRGIVYVVPVPLLTEEAVLDVKDQVEGLFDEIRNSLTEEESKTLLNDVFHPSISFSRLYTLRVDDVFLSTTARELLRRALFDVETAIHSLYRTGDVQGAIFQAHAAGEKFLKAVVVRIDCSTNLKSLGHDIPKVFARLLKADGSYAWLREPVQELQRLAPDMQLRYGTVARTLNDGVTAIHATLFLCGSLAQMWLFENERGQRSPQFKPGCFYKNGTDMSYYCKSVNATQAEFLSFKSSKFTGSQLFTQRIALTWCSLYIEVYDKSEDEQLRKRLLAHMHNPGTKVDPADLSIRHVNGPRGVYTVGTIRRKIQGP